MEVLNKYPPKEKKKIGRKPKYKLECMNMVASKVVDEGMKFREVAKIFNVSQGSVNVWVKTIRLKRSLKTQENQILVFLGKSTA